MATFYHFPIFNSLSSHKFFSASPFLLHSSHTCQNHSHHCSKIFASSIKKPRSSRKVKSDAELCDEIKEFLSLVGLPQNYVPSMKELSQHGRQDLANIVRRRGHKLIKQLLESSTMPDFTEQAIEKDLAGKLEVLSCEGQDEELRVLAGDVSLSSDAIQLEDASRVDVSSSIETDVETESDAQNHVTSGSSAILSLQEKVARFIQNGELDLVEDSGFVSADKSQGGFDIPESYSADQEHKDLVLCGSSGAETLNGNVTSIFQRVENPAPENITSRSGYVSSEESEELSSVDHDKDLDVEIEAETEAEIKRLKFMLHQKEIELTELRQQIEKEKLALTELQTKAETEISNAQKLISEKDAELQATEESLADLKEVEVQYMGDGETVELAGSFNGWHNKIKMDPQPSSSVIDRDVSRTSRLWRTVLWLYPGLYEIKFIIDGHWRTDPRRESVVRGTIHNNILKVDR